MIAAEAVPDDVGAAARSGRTLRALAFASVVLLTMTLLLTASVFRQTQALDRNVNITSGIVNANVRTVGQVQRELLRTAVELQQDRLDVDELRLKRSFASQRLREVALTYQLQTLGTESLLEEARTLSERWFDEVEPKIIQIENGASSIALRDGAMADIRALELGFNELASRGELNRKQQSTIANDTTIALLDRTRWLAIGLGLVFAGFLFVVVTFGRAFRSFDRQREAASRRLLALNKDLRTVSEVANRTGNLVVITDARGRIEWVNEAFENRTGYALGEVIGQVPGHLLQGPESDPDTIARMREWIRAGEAFTTEVVNYTRDGEPYVLLLEVRPVHDADGTLTNFIAVQTDITEERERQEHLRRAKETAEEIAEHKSQFLASMSHEIRTPLNAVIGLTDLLLGTELDAEQRQFVKTAHSSGTMLLSTINDILSFSAVDAGRIELEQRDFDIRTLVASVAGLLARQAADKGVTLHSEVDEAVPQRVRGDETRLQQVLVNLVGNAVKFTAAGTIAVTARSLGDDPEGGGHGIELVVQDTGIGIEPDRIEGLFDPFVQADSSTTRRYGGSGLGLAIVKRIVELMHGEVEVTSQPGVGTRFVVRLAMPEGDPVDAPVEPIAPRAVTSSHPPLRVLVAEDDKVNQMVITAMLRRFGCEPNVVGNGAEAVDAVHAGTYDLVLMDVQMPVLDGIGAVRRIRDEVPERVRPVVVALTANALAGDRERLIEAGMDDYLSKPVKLEQLSGLLEQVSAMLDLRWIPGDVRV